MNNGRSRKSLENEVSRFAKYCFREGRLFVFFDWFYESINNSGCVPKEGDSLVDGDLHWPSDGGDKKDVYLLEEGQKDKEIDQHSVHQARKTARRVAAERRSTGIRSST
jgi:hypothetical protein